MQNITPSRNGYVGFTVEQAKPTMEWRCFNCGEVFTDRAKAQEHFGYRSITPPLYAADLEELKT